MSSISAFKNGVEAYWFSFEKKILFISRVKTEKSLIYVGFDFLVQAITT
jgi:hypothetical protein